MENINVEATSLEIPDEVLKQAQEANQKVSEFLDKDLKDAWIQTYSGKKLYPFNPSIDDIDICDIAHSLSNMCRFTGHCKNFYSIAQHSVLVSYVAKNNFAALMHDASEYALSDISSPLKKTSIFLKYREYEKQLQSIIYKKFGLPEEELEDIKKADLIVLAAEMRDLLINLHKDITIVNLLPELPFKIIPLSPERAEKLFLDRFYELKL